ncbi:hypothetical protein F7725_012306 [Dissostichus mawsoni]|uniref:Uncharacterized protein n=1 Tax=Dissostichus mawsoni TaxID=36200 RepID=A0A7J5YLZ6_DISMA|nr:hypothetical protein F7725_012306 [Dissostichus mawsoni]
MTPRCRVRASPATAERKARTLVFTGGDLSQQRGQDVVQRLVTDGGVELLEGFSCSFSDFQQRITEAFLTPDADALPLVALLGAQALLQDGNYLREDLLSQFPHQIAQRTAAI